MYTNTNSVMITLLELLSRNLQIYVGFGDFSLYSNSIS